MVVRKLVLSNLSAHKVRVTLTAAAIALSVSLVVSVTSGYSSVEASAYKFLGRFMGSADAMITHKSDPHANIPESVVTELESDPDVRRRHRAAGSRERTGRRKWRGRRRAPGAGDRYSPPEDTRVENLQIKFGDWFNTPGGDVAVVDQVAAGKLGVKVGDSFTLPGPTRSLEAEGRGDRAQAADPGGAHSVDLFAAGNAAEIFDARTNRRR